MSGFYTGKLIKLPGFQLVEQFNFGCSDFKTGTITQTPSTYYQLIPTTYGITASNSNNAFFNNNAARNDLISFPKIYLYLNSTWTTQSSCCIEIRFQHDCDLIHWSSTNGNAEVQYGENTDVQETTVLEEHYFLYSLDREYFFYACGGRELNRNLFNGWLGSSPKSGYIHAIWKNKKTIQFWIPYRNSSDSFLYKDTSSSSLTGSTNFTFVSKAIFATPLEGYQYLTT